MQNVIPFRMTSANHQIASRPRTRNINLRQIFEQNVNTIRSEVQN